MNATTTPACPVCCPHCQEIEGWPYAAGTCDRAGVIVVKLRCSTCHNEWFADAPSPTGVVTVQPRQERPEPLRRG